MSGECNICGALGQHVESECPEATPGSDKAIEQGCTCPVIDNGHGKGRGDGQFVINMDCPIHGIDTFVKKQAPLVQDSLANDS